MKKSTKLNTNVFVLHYEKDDVTVKCIEALTNDPAFAVDFRIIVIDNGSSKPFSAWDLATVRLDENLPLIDAFNAGMEAHPATVYVCLTNDTIPAVGMVGKLVDALSDPTVGIVAPGTNDMGSGVLYVGTQPGDFDTLEAAHVDNVCWAFRHDFTEQVGWPDCTDHTHRACWASNQDYCYRARQAGYKVLAVRGAYLWHAHTGGSDADAFRAGREWLERKYGDEARFVWA